MLFLTERTEFTDFLSLRDVFFLPQILLIVTNYNFFSHRLHRFKDFFSFLIRLFRLCLKRRSMDLHRFLPNGIYISLIFFRPQIAQILQIFFVVIGDFCGQNYNLFLMIIFLSPTDDLFLTEFTEFTDFLSLRDVSLPQILLIVTNYNFFSHRLHRFKDFNFSFIRFAI